MTCTVYGRTAVLVVALQLLQFYCSCWPLWWYSVELLLLCICFYCKCTTQYSIHWLQHPGWWCCTLLVLWLLIAECEAQKPSFITSWSWQGFRQLMLIMLIKQSTSLLLSHNGLSHCQDRLPSVDVYLQCHHKNPMAFYCTCGFLQINLQNTTGIELLPKTIADTRCDKNAQGFAWIVPESKEHCINPLMQNYSDSVLNTPKEVV